MNDFENDSNQITYPKMDDQEPPS